VALKWLGSVKQHFGKRIDPEVVSWLMLAEGLVRYFEFRLIAAHDLFRGAYGVALAFDSVRARPTCAAWMAFVEFNDGRFDSMIRFVGEALSDAAPDDHQARARASLVLADSFHFAGSFTKARPWYDRTRLHAGMEGDGAAMMALMHNMAAFRTNNVRLADAFGTSVLAEAKQASMEAASASNYARAVGLSIWTRDTAPLLQAQTLAVQGQFDDALRLLNAVDVARLPPREKPMLAIEHAWCLAHLDCLDQAAPFAEEAARAVESMEDFDDMAYIFARLAALEKMLGCGYLPGCTERAAESLAKHRDGQRALASKLDALDQRLSQAERGSADRES
jgi:tetratricopeptide (TPR) repeat protein